MALILSHLIILLLKAFSVNFYIAIKPFFSSKNYNIDIFKATKTIT